MSIDITKMWTTKAMPARCHKDKEVTLGVGQLPAPVAPLQCIRPTYDLKNYNTFRAVFQRFKTHPTLSFGHTNNSRLKFQRCTYEFSIKVMAVVDH